MTSIRLRQQQILEAISGQEPLAFTAHSEAVTSLCYALCI